MYITYLHFPPRGYSVVIVNGTTGPVMMVDGPAGPMVMEEGPAGLVVMVDVWAIFIVVVNGVHLTAVTCGVSAKYDLTSIF